MTRFIEGLLRTAERSLARGLSEGMTCAGGTPMRTGRPIPPLTLTEDERDTLERWAPPADDRPRPRRARAIGARVRRRQDEYRRRARSAIRVDQDGR